MARERDRAPEITYEEWLDSTLETCRSATRTVEAIYVTMAEIQKRATHLTDYLNRTMGK